MSAKDHVKRRDFIMNLTKQTREAAANPASIPARDACNSDRHPASSPVSPVRREVVCVTRSGTIVDSVLTSRGLGHVGGVEWA